MRLSPNLKFDLSIAAALAGLGLLEAASRHPAPQRSRPLARETTLDTLRRELRDEPAGERHQREDDLGRNARSPGEIPARGWWAIAKRVYQQFSDHRIMAEAAGVTFYALLAIFPAIAALISLYGLFADPNTISDHLDAVNGFIPGGGVDILGDQIKRIASTSGGALSFGAVFGLLAALWSANGGTKSMFDALNVVFDETEKRSYIRRTLISLALTFGALIFIILALTTVIALPIALNYVGLSEAGELMIRLLRWPMMMVIIGLLLAVIYRYGPSRTKARWRWVTWGGAIAAVAWVAVSALFSWYVGHFGSYNKTYGSLGAAIGFMTWIWISAMVALVGAEIDAEMEHQTRRDTTPGPEKPIGERGATKADHVAAS